jgi:hypothetical protein
MEEPKLTEPYTEIEDESLKKLLNDNEDPREM